MFAKTVTRALWSLFLGAVFVGYTSTLLELAQIGF